MLFINGIEREILWLEFFGKIYLESISLIKVHYSFNAMHFLLVLGNCKVFYFSQWCGQTLS